MWCMCDMIASTATRVAGVGVLREALLSPKEPERETTPVRLVFPWIRLKIVIIAAKLIRAFGARMRTDTSFQSQNALR